MVELARLPGIGPRSAQRLAFHLMKAPPERARALSEAIADMSERLRPCAVCFSFAEAELCPICADPRRDPRCSARSRSRRRSSRSSAPTSTAAATTSWAGRCRRSTASTPRTCASRELVARIDADGVAELVIATNPTMSGEATALYLADLVRGRVRVTRLASGLPVGADLEHADELTLGRALLGRREL